MGKKILVIGGGFIGGIIAKDLKQAGYTVSVADFDAKLAAKFEKQDIGFVQVDVTDSKSVKAAVEDFDVVAGAVPSKFGFAMTKAVIEAGKPLADVSFTPEDARQLSALAKEKGVPVVIDCGFAPGMPNLVWGRAIENQFSSIEDATYYVGGIPEKKRPPWNYVSTWCVEDTIEEFTRPARVKRDNQIVTLPAASDLEPKTIDELKDVELEAFVTDGLRSLLDLPIPAMQEKTLRYPGHVADMLKLRDSGALSGDKLKSTTEQLANEWKATDEFKRDVVILQSVITGIGKQSGKRARETMTMIDRYDDATQLTAMSRCTAFSVSITAQLLAEGEFSTSGVHPPETLGRDETVFQRYMTLYKQRGIEFKFRVETLE